MSVRKSFNCRWIKNLASLLFLLTTLFLASSSFALPFSIVPNGALPTTFPFDGTTTASYTVANNTGQQRNNNYVQYLPPNVSILPAGCGSTFSLAASGQAGSSCILNLLIVGPVNGSDPDPTHHLFVCFPGGKTCAGTLYPLNVVQGPPDIVSITITPLTASIAAGFTQQYTAMGTYTDETVHDVTSQVSWNSDNSAAATINGNGLATGVAIGSAQITANFGAIISNPATLTVTAAVLQTISVAPTSATITVGGQQQFTATGHYSDSSTQDLSSLAAWNSSSPAVATIDVNGLATGVSLGTTNITANYLSITSNAASLLVSQFAYVTNSSSNTVSYCVVNTNGSFGACNVTGNALNTPQGITLNSAKTKAYITNYGDDTVVVCPINANGSFGTCSTTGSGPYNNPSAITLNPGNTLAYVVNSSGSIEVLYCVINGDDTLGACTDTTASGLTLPNGIKIDNANAFAYVSDNTGNLVFYCPINVDGSFAACVDTSGVGFSGPVGITLNPLNTLSYIANSSGNAVSFCTVVGDGTFSGCSSTGTGFSNPQGIAINTLATFMYVANSGANTVSICSISGDGSLGVCSAATGFANPNGVVVP